MTYLGINMLFYGYLKALVSHSCASGRSGAVLMMEDARTW